MHVSSFVLSTRGSGAFKPGNGKELQVERSKKYKWKGVTKNLKEVEAGKEEILKLVLCLRLVLP